MIQIPEPPDVTVCGSCMRALIWLYSFRTGQTFSVVVDDTDRTGTLHIHRCKPLQSPIVWRALSATPTAHQHEINAAGRARAVEAIKSKSVTDEMEENET